jgi:hypothetical protein
VNGLAGPAHYLIVGVEQGPARQPRQYASDNAFAGGHETHEDDVLGVFQS